MQNKKRKKKSGARGARGAGRACFQSPRTGGLAGWRRRWQVEICFYFPRKRPTFDLTDSSPSKEHVRSPSHSRTHATHARAQPPPRPLKDGCDWVGSGAWGVALEASDSLRPERRCLGQRQRPCGGAGVFTEEGAWVVGFQSPPPPTPPPTTTTTGGGTVPLVRQPRRRGRGGRR